MRRPTQHLIIDFVAFTLFVLLAATGVLMYFILPPGSHSQTIWGMDRHVWGDLHFWIAVGMVVTIGLHLILHGRWITSMVRGRGGQGRSARRRVLLALTGVGLLLVLAAAPLVSPVEQAPGTRASHAYLERPAGRGAGSEVRASMSLYDVEHATGVSVAFLVRELDLPLRTSSDVLLRDLRGLYGITVADVRELVRQEGGRGN